MTDIAPPPSHHSPQVPTLLSFGITGLLLLVGGQLIFAELIKLFLPIEQLNISAFILITMLITYGVFFWWFRAISARYGDIAGALDLRRPVSLNYMIWLPISFYFLNNLLSLVMVKLFYDPTLIQQAQDAQQSLFTLSDAPSPFVIFLTFITVAVVAPIVEEIVFRGFLLKGLERKIGLPLAVVATSLLFAAIHFNPTFFPFLAIIGALCAGLTILTGSLRPAIMLHIFNNSSVLIASFLP